MCEKIDINTSAIKRPNEIGIKAYFSFILRPDATTAPVQPPVPIRRTATKINLNFFYVFLSTPCESESQLRMEIKKCEKEKLWYA